MGIICQAEVFSDFWVFFFVHPESWILMPESPHGFRPNRGSSSTTGAYHSCTHTCSSTIGTIPIHDYI